MKVKIFIPNSNGKIEFTKDELEKLLDEVYQEGYDEGRQNCIISYPPGLQSIPNIIYSDSTSTGGKPL